MSFGAAFGAGRLVFTGPLGVPALDGSVLLLSFLVLLGDRFWWPGPPHGTAPEPVAQRAPAGTS